MIDVLLPYYGDPTLMREAVDSIMRQTSDAWRLIIVDDCYPDPEMGSWLKSLSNDRVEYHRNEQNLGANRTYTKALGLAKADYVVVMGADDRMLPNYIATMQRAIEQFPGVSMIVPRVRVIDENGEEYSPLGDRVKRLLSPHGEHMVRLAGEPLQVSLLRGAWTYFPSICWNRSTIAEIGFRPEFHIVQDLALQMDVTRRGGDLVVCPDVAFEYRRHKASDSAVKTLEGARFREEAKLFSDLEAQLTEDGSPRAARAARMHLTSRLHAATLMPRAVAKRDSPATKRLARHAFAGGDQNL